VAITTPIMPNTPVKIDFDFLVESDSDPVTFIATTWGKPKTLFRTRIRNSRQGVPAKRTGPDSELYPDLCQEKIIQYSFSGCSLNTLQF